MPACCAAWTAVSVRGLILPSGLSSVPSISITSSLMLLGGVVCIYSYYNPSWQKQQIIASPLSPGQPLPLLLESPHEHTRRAPKKRPHKASTHQQPTSH